jgi:hypothetical protein
LRRQEARAVGTGEVDVACRLAWRESRGRRPGPVRADTLRGQIRRTPLSCVCVDQTRYPAGAERSPLGQALPSRSARRSSWIVVTRRSPTGSSPRPRPRRSRPESGVI